MDTDLCLSTIRGDIFTEDDGRGSSDPDRKVGEDGREDGPPFLVPSDTERRYTQDQLADAALIFGDRVPHSKSQLLNYTLVHCCHLQKQSILFCLILTPISDSFVKFEKQWNKKSELDFCRPSNVPIGEL